MIITTTDEAVRVGAGPSAAPPAAWTCLVRRGMLHSECESVEHWRLAPAAPLEATPRHGVEEAVLVLDGTLDLATASGERTLGAGALALLPHGGTARLTAGPRGARIVTVRALAAPVTDRLPPRVPELIDT
ncbi:hypothetical protein ACFWNK_23090 [Streptomyces sp. NPDC058417]|uniref:hypothetical protein n=1 Tax=unclassified Streptomyces TaxID=2593676 RepID=UPI00364EC8A6